MNRITRSIALKIAAMLSFFIGASSIIGSLPYVLQGAAAIDASPDSPPYFVLLIGLLTGLLGVVAAYGVWKQQQRGIALTILVNAINGLSAAPGILFAPDPGLRILAVVTVIISVLIVVLCLWRERGMATA